MGDRRRHTDIELFAGAGGLALGLERAGFEGLTYVEMNGDACETLRRNRPEWNVIEGDVHEIDFRQYDGQVDLVSGGFPCQAFSMAGKRLGFGDIRGTLFAEIIRCANETHPKMLLMENVKGLLSHDGGRTFETIRHEVEKAGYSLQWKILNASYHGVGQARERIVMIGIRDDLSGKISFEYPKTDNRQTTLRDAIDGVPDSPGASYSEGKAKVLDLVPPGGCWIDLPQDIAREYMKSSYDSPGGKRGMARRLSWGRPCLTLTTSPSQKQTERCHPDETRPLTVREYARVQSFPDDWEFAGGIGSQYRQIGNAVPVEMARRIGVQIIKALDGK